MNITDIAKAVAPKAKQKIIGIRPGEKIHEQMIGLEDAPYTFEYEGYFKILPMINNWSNDKKRIKKGKKVSKDFIYSSEKNDVWMTDKQLSKWLIDNHKNFKSI